MTHYLIIPGLGNSGPDHWQTWMEGADTRFRRVWQDEWDAPDRAAWVARIDAAVSQYDAGRVVLVAHSLGCTAVAHWTADTGRKVKGAFLVAPSDIDAPAYTFPSTGFGPMPLAPLPFPSTVLTSSDDPWVRPERAALFASSWGSRLIDIGPAGHINSASGHGPWPEGLQLLYTHHP